jgi:hypothetical protein
MVPEKFLSNHRSTMPTSLASCANRQGPAREIGAFGDGWSAASARGAANTATATPSNVNRCFITFSFGPDGRFRWQSRRFSS